MAFSRRADRRGSAANAPSPSRRGGGSLGPQDRDHDRWPDALRRAVDRVRDLLSVLRAHPKDLGFGYLELLAQTAVGAIALTALMGTLFSLYVLVVPVGL